VDNYDVMHSTNWYQGYNQRYTTVWPVKKLADQEKENLKTGQIIWPVQKLADQFKN